MNIRIELLMEDIKAMIEANLKVMRLLEVYNIEVKTYLQKTTLELLTDNFEIIEEYNEEQLHKIFRFLALDNKKLNEKHNSLLLKLLSIC